MTDGVWPDERAGWWSRTLSLLFDCVCVIVPSAVLGALLYAMTSGHVQWAAPGLEWQTCASITSLPANLAPPPPAHSNAARECQDYSVAGPIGRTLTVTRTSQDNGATTSVSQNYMLQRSGEIGGYDLSWITWAALLALLIGCEWQSGTTPGKRLLGLRVVGVQDPTMRSVPLKQVATRYGAAIAGVLIPTGAALAIILVPVASGSTPSGFSFMIVALLLGLSAAWQIWNLVRIVRRRPTVYDHMAGVEIIRTRPRSPDIWNQPA